MLSIVDKLVESLKVVFNFRGGDKKQDSPSIQAGGSVKAGGPIIVGNQSSIQVHKSIPDLSRVEKKVINFLYAKYKKDGVNYPVDVIEIFKSVGIQDGQYVGTLNTSTYVKSDGSHLRLTDDGIRLMDNLSK